MASTASVLPSSHEIARREIATARAESLSQPSLWRRLINRMQEGQRRRAERDVARYLAITGLKFTDSTEREIEQRFLTPNRFHPQLNTLTPRIENPMPVFYPNGPAAKALPYFAGRRSFAGWLRAFFEAFTEARAMENDAFKAGRLVNR